MAVITQDVIKQATVAITAGADGIYYSTQAIQDDRLDHHDFKELVEKYDRQIIRGAYQAVDRQQLDAAQALGYTSWQTYRFIKLPQALVEALPKLLNYYLLLIRQLSLAFLVSFIDIFCTGTTPISS